MSWKIPEFRLGPKGFWREAFDWWRTTTIGLVMSLVISAIYATVVVWAFRTWFPDSASSREDPMLNALVQGTTSVLGFLMVLRLNVGYQRWWEARTLWGAMINHSRNLAITSLAHGPRDRAWRSRTVRWVASFGHVARRSLRGSRELPEVAALLSAEDADEVARANHMTSYVALRIGDQLREACDEHLMDPFGFHQADRERSALIDSIGGCERILRTPVARLYVIATRRLILLLILTGPFAGLELLDSFQYWNIPLFVVMALYPLMLLDELAAELEDPFNLDYLGCLPLENYTQTIEENLLSLIEEDKWHE